jgi:hypothetical protein
MILSVSLVAVGVARGDGQAIIGRGFQATAPTGWGVSNFSVDEWTLALNDTRVNEPEISVNIGKPNTYFGIGKQFVELYSNYSGLLKSGTSLL